LVHQTIINVCIPKRGTSLHILSRHVAQKMLGICYAWGVLVSNVEHISDHLGILNCIKLAKINRLQNCVLFYRSEDCPDIVSFEAHIRDINVPQLGVRLLEEVADILYKDLQQFRRFLRFYLILHTLKSFLGFSTEPSIHSITAKTEVLKLLALLELRRNADQV